MTNYQPDYSSAGFYFKVIFEEVNEKYEAGFQEVSGLNIKLQTEEIAEGGENRFKYKLPSPAKYTNLLLKRGLVSSEPFMKWIAGALDLQAKITTKTINLILVDEHGLQLVSWTFYNAYPVSVHVSNLNPIENNYAIETMELAYSYFESSDTKNN